MKKITVIVPTFNNANTINKCIDSILNQTYKAIDLIVINDNSTDETLNILKKYKDKITLINNKKNLGPSASRNKGLDLASGTYIGFVDADDYIDPNMYETLVNEMNKEVDLVCAGRTNIYKNKTKDIINKTKENDPHIFSSTSNYVWDKLFKRSIIDKYELRLPENYSYAEDFYFLMKYKFYAKKMKIVEKPLYFYNVDRENSITNSYKNNLLNIINVLQEIVIFFKNNNSFEDNELELLKISSDFYMRRIKEFKKFKNIKLKMKFVNKFQKFLKTNFKDYGKYINTNRKRTSKLIMFAYIIKSEIR